MTSVVLQEARSKGRIRRHGTLNVQALGPQFLKGGLDHIDLLAAQMPGLARVRIEPQDGDSRCGQRELPLHVHIDDAKSGEQPLARDGARHVGQRQVSGHQRDP